MEQLNFWFGTVCGNTGADAVGEYQTLPKRGFPALANSDSFYRMVVLGLQHVYVHQCSYTRLQSA